MGPAASSEARPLITWPPRAGSTNTAPVNAASSASVEEGGCLKNIGCAIPPAAVRPTYTPERRLRSNGAEPSSCSLAISSRGPDVRSLQVALERCATAELELLHAVKLTLRNRNRIVEAQRAERRSPDEADTHRASDHVAVVKLQSCAGAGTGWSRVRRLGRPDATGHVDLARLRPRRRPLVVEQSAGVGIDRTLEPDFLRQEPERHLQFERSAPVLGAAECVTRAERIDVARTDAVRRKTANQVRTHLEVIQHAQLAAAELVQHAALEMDQANDIGDQRGVVLRVDRRLDVLHVAADTGEVLLPVDQQAVGRVLVVVQRVVVQRVADRRGQRLAALQFLSDRQRGFAIKVAAELRAINGTDQCGSESSRAWIVGRIWRHAIRQERVVVTIPQGSRQRDLLLIDRVAHLKREIFPQGETEPRAEAERLGAVSNIAVGQLLAIEQVEAERDTIVEQVGIDE